MFQSCMRIVKVTGHRRLVEEVIDIYLLLVSRMRYRKERKRVFSFRSVFLLLTRDANERGK